MKLYWQVKVGDKIERHDMGEIGCPKKDQAMVGITLRFAGYLCVCETVDVQGDVVTVNLTAMGK